MKQHKNYDHNWSQTLSWCVHNCCGRPPEPGGTCCPFGWTSSALGWEGGRRGVGGSLTTDQFLLSKKRIAQTTQRRPAVRGRASQAIQCGMIVFCVFGEKLHAGLQALLPVFLDRWHFLLWRTAAVLSGAGQTQMIMKFWFPVFPLL